MSRQYQEEFYNTKYSFDINQKSTRYLYASMNDVLVITLNMPSLNNTQLTRVIMQKVQKEYPDDLYYIASIDEGYATVFVFNKWLLDTVKDSKIKKFLPEIYMVPFNNRLSVCKVIDGYIVRTSQDSGFRLNDRDAVKEYINGKEYDLYNFTEARMGNSWRNIYKKNHLKDFWNKKRNPSPVPSEYKKPAVKTEKTISGFITGLLIVLILGVWGFIYYNNTKIIADYDNAIAEMKADKREMVYPYPTNITASHINTKQANKKKTQISKYFDNLVSRYYKDSFSIFGNTIKVKTQRLDNRPKNLNNYKVYYE